MNTTPVASGYPNRRRVYLVNPKFQYRVIGYFVGLTVVLISIFYSVNLLFFWKFKKLGESLHFAEDHSFYRFLAEQKQFIDFCFLGVSVVAFVTLIVFALIFSHRIAGPLHRLQSDFLEMAKTGKLRNVKFRTHDFFPEVADSANAFIKTVKSDKP